MGVFTDGTQWTDGTGWTDSPIQSPLTLDIVALSTAIDSLDDLLSMADSWTLASVDIATKLQAIVMAESEMNDRLRIQLLEDAEIFKARSGGLVLPINVRSVREIYAQDSKRPLKQMRMNVLERMLAWGTAGGPASSYAVNGHILTFLPAPTDGTEFLVWFYKDIDSLNTSNKLNAVLARHPHIYFAGMMKWIESFLQNPEQSAKWEALFYPSMERLVQQDRIDRTGPAPLIGRYGALN